LGEQRTDRSSRNLFGKDQFNFYPNHLERTFQSSWLKGKAPKKPTWNFQSTPCEATKTYSQIIDEYDRRDFCQIQYNYADQNYQAGTRGLKYAAYKGLAVVVMKPMAGDKLAILPPATIQALWEKLEIRRSPAEWALRWVWSHPEVSVILSGMSTMSQVVENVLNANYSQPNNLTEKQLALFNQVRRKYKKLDFVSSSGCRYCMLRPQGVNIPEVLALHNEYYVRNRAQEVKSKYRKQIPPENRASKCIRCGRCEEICPQKVPIPKLLSEAAFVIEQE
jgi:predicted aldo/keto reductase-like oxidoreductase